MRKDTLTKFFLRQPLRRRRVSVTAILIIVVIALLGIIITGIYPALNVTRKTARNTKREGICMISM